MNYKVGDKVQIKDGRWGTVVEIEHDSIGDSMVKIDLGGSTVWTWSNKIPKQQSACTCGVKYVRDGGEHSDWCDIKKGGSNDTVYLSTGFTNWPGW